MRALSPATLSFVDELNRLANDSAPLRLDRLVDIQSVLDRIVDAGEPFVIPRIIALALDRRRGLAEAVGDAVGRLLRSVSVRDVGMFDRAFRAVAPFTHRDCWPWDDLSPDDLGQVASLASGPALLQLAMCHPRGRVREAAIRRAATCADGGELAFLLLRTNDWVAPVREAALTALRVRLTIEHASDLVAALPMLDAMAGWGRLGSSGIRDQIESLLRDPRAVPALRAVCASSDPAVRRGAYRRLLAAGHTGDAEHDIVVAALRDPDPAIRHGLMRWLLGAPPEVFTAFADRLMRDRSGTVRFGAVQRLLELGASPRWDELLLDRHAGVRALAQDRVLDADRDPAAEYRAATSSSRPTRLGLALVGLGETGGPGDEPLVRGFLRDRHPTVRASALRALASFKVDDIVSLSLEALCDESSNVNRTARDLLVERRATVRAEDVWAAFPRAHDDRGRIAALAVLSQLDYWEAFPSLLRAWVDSDGPVKERAALHLTEHLARRNRVFAVPSPAIADQLRELVANPQFGDQFRRELLGMVESRTVFSPGPRSS